MFFIEMSYGEDVRVGPCTLRLLAVFPDDVVIAVLDPAHDCVFCGGRASRLRCPFCQAETLVCPHCVASQPCPQCASPWELA